MSYREAENILKGGGVGVMPTDTIYGLVGSALNKKTVERIYKVRERNPAKPFIVLIGSLKDLLLFGVKLDGQMKILVQKFWPGKVSVILPVKGKRFFYLHRGAESLAFRLPKRASLRNFLRRVRPLVAPSANPEGSPPAKNITEAKKYFGERIDFYLPGHIQSNKPSTLIEIKEGKVKVLREGVVKIKNL